MIKFSDINKGTYVAIKFNSDTCEQLQVLQNILNLPNKVPLDKLHSTICFSRIKIPYKALEETNFEIGTAKSLEVFEHKNKRALVLLLDSKFLEDRHKYSMILGATYDFPEYRPHVTLSYDIGNLFIDDALVTMEPLVASHEYTEDLDLNWEVN